MAEGDMYTAQHFEFLSRYDHNSTRAGIFLLAATRWWDDESLDEGASSRRSLWAALTNDETN